MDETAGLRLEVHPLEEVVGFVASESFLLEEGVGLV